MRSRIESAFRRLKAERSHEHFEPGLTIEMPREIGIASKKVARWVVRRVVIIRENPHVELERNFDEVRKVLSADSIWSIYKGRVVESL